MGEVGRWGGGGGGGGEGGGGGGRWRGGMYHGGLEVLKVFFSEEQCGVEGSRQRVKVWLPE